MADNLECNFPLTVCEVLFGINPSNDPNLKIINYLILMGKWYINNTKQDENVLYFFDFLRILQGKIGTFIRANSINNKEMAEWQQIFADALLTPEPVIPDKLLFFSHMSIHYYIN